MARFTTERGFDRVVFFSDATVAIALTLLVLPLADLASAAHGLTTRALIDQNFSAIVAFVISFVVIAVVWLEHHRLFESLANYSWPLLLINFVWLFAVVGLPFSTEANEEAPGSDRGAIALYIANLLLAFVAIALMRITALRNPRLIEPSQREHFSATESIALVILCVIALIVAVSVPAIGMWSLFLLALSGVLSRLLRGMRRSR
ncbi:TMEM175 family protein [Gryllotalpicola reticulitermitis]|uniref:TMEM175 family protein n=1 Tax=Gryllotalpicola reticulitermitis TaxID=1184153 RepID=A0ABV8Q5D7_9MICO